LKGRKCFCDFHVFLFSEAQTLLDTNFPNTLEILHRKTADVYLAYYTLQTWGALRRHLECNWKATFGV
jgi:hypothetical protein